MLIDVTSGNDPMRQQTEGNTNCYKCCQKVITGKTVLIQLIQAKDHIKI